jgi:hypothetical protein
MRVFCNEGLVRHRSAETLLTSLTDIRTQIGFFGRQLGFGNVVLISASGEVGTDRFTGLFKQAILEQKARAMGGMGGGMASSNLMPSHSASHDEPGVLTRLSAGCDDHRQSKSIVQAAMPGLVDTPLHRHTMLVHR